MSALDIDAAEYRRLVADAPEPTLVADGDGTVLMASRRALDMFGYDAGEILGTRIETLLDPSAAKPLADGSENPSWELHGRRKDGAVFLVGMRTNRVERSRQLTIVVLRDLTPERTREDELRIARDSAAAESRAKSKFLATASHDLRQPLQTMRLLNQSLADAIETPELRELLEHQARAIGAMGDLLNALLDISKLEAGMVTAQIADTDLGALFTALGDEFAPLAAARGLAFVAEPGAPSVRSDPVLLGQILRNLLGNAIKFTERGTVRLSASSDGTRVRVVVTDTGIGIPPDQIPRLGEEFYRVPRADGRAVDGFGLGLSIVHRLADLVGATVEIASEPGRGTRVALDVPAASGVAGGPRRIASRARPPLLDGPRDVLVVEDDPGLRYATKRWLSGRGLRVEAVGDGQQALSVLGDGFVPSLVVADFHLANGETALDVVQRVRQSIGRDVPALVLSGDTSPAAQAAVSVAGMGLLLKPIDPQDLLEQIRRLLR
jgi:two-component system CheB/CheR fusion protein